MDESNDHRCSFSFDPAEWEATNGETSPLVKDLDGDIWECPHEVNGADDLCLFHRPVEEQDPGAVRAAFLEQIDEPGAEAKQFVGARFGPLNLNREILQCPDNHLIDLRHARFEGESRWRYTIVEQPIDFSGARFLARPRFTEVEFAGEVNCHRVRFEAAAWFFEAEFAAGLWGNNAQFAEANFHNATFGGPVDLSESSFKEVKFQEATFETTAKFNSASFVEVSFAGARFGERLYLDGVTVPEQLSILKATVEELASFRDLDLAGASCCIDLSNSVVLAGRLPLPPAGELVYDLTDAKLGDVTLASDDPPSDLFDHYRFLYTTFDGFDFGEYCDVLHSVQWRLHEVVDVPELDPGRTRPATATARAPTSRPKTAPTTLGTPRPPPSSFAGKCSHGATSTPRRCGTAPRTCGTERPPRAAGARTRC